MWPTAIYGGTNFDRSMVRELSTSYSDWYYSEEGGLMLTTPTHELYFTLQCLLRSLGDGADWTGERVNNPRDLFLALLDERSLLKAKKFLVDLDERYLLDWPGRFQCRSQRMEK